MIMKHLKIAFIQHNISWKETSANLKAYEDHIHNLSEKVDLILLPETCNTGFCIDDLKITEELDGQTVTWMTYISEIKNTCIGGSIFCKSNKGYTNRFVVVYPDGQLEYYDKRHLFGMGREDELFTAGEVRKIIDIKGWKICLNICYDLRFPVWSRNEDGYDLLLYIANWPEPRANAWRDLLKARAIENMCYVIGVNRIGLDGYSNNHIGDSTCIDPMGIIQHYSGDKEELAVVILDFEEIEKNRTRFGFLNDRDKFSIH